ncbi:peptidase S8/S53 domain-containing protein [Corynascus similis CBS 632.67]
MYELESSSGKREGKRSSREVRSTQNNTASGEEVRTGRPRTRGTPPIIVSEDGQPFDPTTSVSVAQTPPIRSQSTEKSRPRSAHAFPENPHDRTYQKSRPRSTSIVDLTTLGGDILGEQPSNTSVGLHQGSQLTPGYPKELPIRSPSVAKRKRPSSAPDPLKKPTDQEHRNSPSNFPNPKPALGDPATLGLGGGVLGERPNETSAELPEASESTTEAGANNSKFISQGVNSDSNTSNPEPANPNRIPSLVKGSICDATSQLVNDASVDMWFADIERINEEIFQPYRRQVCKRVKVGILDTGIDMKNAVFRREEVRSRIKKRVDFCDPNGKGSCRDRCGHGTHCAALINRIAPAADIYVGRVAVDFDSGLDENVVAKAICVALGSRGPGEASQNWDVDILSLSLGFQHFSEAIDAALRSSASRGKIVLAAASNNGTLRTMAYPAWDPNVIPINSANARGRPSDFNPPAMPGKTLTFLGENVPSAWITTTTRATTASSTTTTTTTTTDLARSVLDDKYNNNNPEAANPEATSRMSGTSVATPIAAGLVALLFELTTIQVGDDEAAAQATLRAVLPTIRRQVGLQRLLAGRAVQTGDFHNVVPRALLNPDLTVGENAAVIKGVLAGWFGFRT